jgi:hypothetical protein
MARIVASEVAMFMRAIGLEPIKDPAANRLNIQRGFKKARQLPKIPLRRSMTASNSNVLRQTSISGG